MFAFASREVPRGAGSADSSLEMSAPSSSARPRGRCGSCARCSPSARRRAPASRRRTSASPRPVVPRPRRLCAPAREVSPPPVAARRPARRRPTHRPPKRWGRGRTSTRGGAGSFTTARSRPPPPRRRVPDPQPRAPTQASAAGFGFFDASDSDSDAFAAADSSAASVGCTRQYPSETPGRNSPSFSRRVPSSSRGGRRHSSPTPPEEGARTHKPRRSRRRRCDDPSASIRRFKFKARSASRRRLSHSGSESRPERCMRSAGRDGEESSSPRVRRRGCRRRRRHRAGRASGRSASRRTRRAPPARRDVRLHDANPREVGVRGDALRARVLERGEAELRVVPREEGREREEHGARVRARAPNGSVQRLTANASRKPRTPCLIESAAWTYDANAAYGATNANHRAASPNWKPSSAYPGGDAMARRARAPGGDAGRNRRRRRRGSSFSVLLIGVPTVVPSNCQKRACRLRFLA